MIKEKFYINYNKINNSNYLEISHNKRFTSHLISPKDKIELQNMCETKYMEIYE